MDPFLFGPALAGGTYISDWRREATCLQGAQTRQAIKGPANLITGRGATNGGGRGGGGAVKFYPYNKWGGVAGKV